MSRPVSRGATYAVGGQLPTLTVWEKYTREQVHAIFAPDTPFTPQSGTWGLQGIVRIPERPGSYVFFVTFGQTQGAHSFDESVTEDGVLTWQSQPKQRLADPIIQDLITHDWRQSSIYLFLRTHRRVPYTYCGRLGYLSHDSQREMPVHFQWQLLDWPAPDAVVAAVGLVLTPRNEGSAATSSPPVQPGALVEVPPPFGAKPGGTKTSTFKALKRAFHPDQDARNKKLGLAGELLVLTGEKQRLVDAGRSDLASRVVHVSVVEGDGAGYDIRSFDLDGHVRHLEVKTTRSGESAAFFISPNEVAFSEVHAGSFELVRVYDYDEKANSGRCYRISGPITAHFALEPTQYRALLT